MQDDTAFGSISSSYMEGAIVTDTPINNSPRKP
jgi:hypothetical protein